METSIHDFIATIEPYFGHILTLPFLVGSVFLVYALIKPAATAAASTKLWAILKDIFAPPPVYCPRCKGEMKVVVMWVDAYYKCRKCGLEVSDEEI